MRRRMGIFVAGAIAACAGFETGSPADAGLADGGAPDGSDGGDAGAVPATVRDAYAESVLQDAPVGYWRMALVGGLVENEIDGGAPLVAEASGTDATNDGPLAGVNQAVRFSGPNVGGLHAADPTAYDLNGGQELTLECWIRVDGSTHDTALIARDVAADGGLIDGYALAVASTRKLIVISGGAAGNANGASVDPMPDGWHHVVMVATGGQLTGYLDGKTISSKSIPSAATPKASVPLSIGFEPARAGTWHFQGVIDEVAVYDHALLPNQVARHYEAARSH